MSEKRRYTNKQPQHSKAGSQRTVMPESVQRKVENEGITARNLIKFNVPMDTRSSRKHSISDRTGQATKKSGGLMNGTINGDSGLPGPRDSVTSARSLNSSFRSAHSQQTTTAQAQMWNNSDYRARYWGQMMDTLKRTIDEIYSACETDESEMECKEVIMILEHSKKDFHSLIEKMNLLREYENTDEQNRPTSLAWDERKTSPGKPIMKQVLERRRKSHQFSILPVPLTATIVKKEVSTCTWADRVRGVVPVVQSTSREDATPPCAGDVPTNDPSMVDSVLDQEYADTVESVMEQECADTVETLLEQECADTVETLLEQECADTVEPNEEGWETVHRQKTKSKSSPRPTSLRKQLSSRSNSRRGAGTPLRNTRDDSNLNKRQSKSEGNLLTKSTPLPAKPVASTGRKTPTLDTSRPQSRNSWGAMVPQKSTRDPLLVKGTQRGRMSGDTPRLHSAKLPETEVHAPQITSLSKQLKVHSAEDVTEIVKTAVKVEPVIETDKTAAENELILADDKTVEIPGLNAASEGLDLMTSSVESIQPCEGSPSSALNKSNVSLNSVEGMSGEEEELRHFDKELENMTNVESALTCELDRAQAEVADYRRQMEEDEKKEEAKVVMQQATDTSLTWDEIMAQQDKMQGLSWDLIAQLEEEEDEDAESEKMRTPGRGIQMHEKLSMPSRKRADNSMQKLEEKQAKAKELREKLLLERADKVRDLTRKVEEVRQQKDHLLDAKKDWMEERLRRAEEKRQVQLERRVRKAHDEETKGREIAFIQSLEAAQKQHSIKAKHQESEARLHEIQEERRRKMGEKADREAAAEERRRALEATRQARLQELQERWENRARDFASRAETREKTRQAAARAKELDREHKMGVLEQQHKEYIEQLKNKIQKKHEESERRHQEQLREISRKGFEMSVLKHSTEDSTDAPPIEPYAQKKLCTACNVLIDSEVFLQSHLRGKIHKNSIKEKTEDRQLDKEEIESFNLEHILDAPSDEPDPRSLANKERRKAMKKRIKKIKQRMTVKGAEFEKALQSKNFKVPDTANKSKYLKFVKDTRRYMNITDSGPWVASRVAALDKSLGDAFRSLDRKMETGPSLDSEVVAANAKELRSAALDLLLRDDQTAFVRVGGIGVLESILNLMAAQKPDHTTILPDKSYQLACQIYRSSCVQNHENCCYVLLSNRTGSLIDLLNLRLNTLIPDDFEVLVRRQLVKSGTNEMPVDPVASSLMDTLTCVMEGLLIAPISPKQKGDLHQVDPQRAQDLISYTMSLGVVDRLADYLTRVRGPLPENSPTGQFVLSALSLIAAMLRLLANAKRLHSQQLISFTQTPPPSGSATPEAGANNNCASSLASNGAASICSLHLTPQEDPTQLLAAVCATELCGLVCLLYGLLLYSAPPPLDNIFEGATGQVTLVGLQMMNSLAAINLEIMQTVLSEEGTSLQLRHILSHLLSACSEKYEREQIENVNQQVASGSKHGSAAVPAVANSDAIGCQELLREVLLCVGYFCVLNRENQNFVQSGQRPTILQRLCQLPFDYFSLKPHTQILYPTLIACCFENEENTEILEQELSCSLLTGFVEEKLIDKKNGSRKDSKSSQNKDESQDARFLFANRFPEDKWEDAQTFFDR